MGSFGVGLFWVGVFGLFWITVGFPTLVVLWAALRGRRVRIAETTPSVSLVIAAHDEAAVIGAKVRNSLELDYPKELLEVIVAADGCVDSTVAIVRGLSVGRVRVLDLPRHGKIHAVNEAVATAAGDLIVFTDANTMLERDSLRLLARNFADPQVGGVCGNQIHRLAAGSDSTGQGESLYWKYDKWLKSRESATGSIVSADGALYAIRRSLYRRPPSAVNDDFAISTAVIEQGFRLVFERDAIAIETPAERAEQEFERKVRIVSRGVWSVLAARGLLNPMRHGFYSVVLSTHKILRRLVPIFMGTILAGSWISISRGALYAWATWIQLGFYFFALVGFLTRTTRFGKLPFVGLPYFFCLTNAAVLAGLVRAARGDKRDTWRPTRRSAVT